MKNANEIHRTFQVPGAGFATDGAAGCPEIGKI
jgi:hypothetical protein